jgi:hypothetical protein
MGPQETEIMMQTIANPMQTIENQKAWRLGKKALTLQTKILNDHEYEKGISFSCSLRSNPAHSGTTGKVFH